MFMTGVYQEVMGSVHNMFGSLNTVVVRAVDSPLADDSHKTGGWVGGGLKGLRAAIRAARLSRRPPASRPQAFISSPACRFHSHPGPHPPKGQLLSPRISAPGGTASAAASMDDDASAAVSPVRRLMHLPSVLTEYNAQFVGDGFILEHVVRGETVGEVLSRAHHHAPQMLAAVRAAAGAAAGRGEIDKAAASRLVENYARRLEGYT
jgi:hypothetical protein